ncbi:MAG: GH116 family glycosyl hydrolase [Candidatus Hydrogenedentes bacterium]|nr:GH116 family glycosyl hydrolase [Candidatus Hydrogenedentota bacterium]
MASMLILFLAAASAPQFETFNAPGYSAPVCGAWYKPGEAASAMPLGGLGTGFIDFTAAATFGDNTIKNNWLKPLPASRSSYLSVNAAGKNINLRPNPENPRAMRYWGHYPAADVDFGGTFENVRVHLRAFAPVIPHDADTSGLPVALFRFRISNEGKKDAPVEVGMQWENSRDASLESTSNGQGPQIADSVVSISDGLMTVSPHGSVAIAARADADDWTIQAVRTQGTLTTATAKKTLAPGESSIVTLALSWNFPEWISSDGERLRHNYAAKYPDAGAVMAATLPHAKQLEGRVIAWQEKIYSSNVPGLLKDAVINSLYILPRNSWWIDDGRFFQSESFTGCPITETFVCRFNGSFPLALMWPELEKATMQAVAAAQAETGEIPFGFGSPAGSRSPYFHVQHPIVSSEFVLLCWRNYQLTRDASFLMYDPVKKALRYAMTLDKDGDGLVNEDPGSEKGFPANQYYDIWPWWGTSAYTSSIWLAALRAGEETAKLQGDQPFAEELRGWFDRGRASFEEKLWTGDARARYYRLYNDPAGKRKSDTLLANGLCGQWFAYAAGLGELLPKDRIDSHISAVLRFNATATEYGTVNGVTPDGKPDVTFPDHSAVLTIGETWNFCAMAAFAGRTDEAVALFDKSYANILLNQRTPWNIPWSLDPKSGAIKWGINYYSNPCVWTLFQALAPEAYVALSSAGVPPA